MKYRIHPPNRPGGARILTASEMRAADRHAIEELSVPGVALMENAGRHVARIAQQLSPELGVVNSAVMEIADAIRDDVG